MNKLVATIVFTLSAAISHAGVIDWTDWTSAVEGEMAEGNVGGVGVQYNGSLFFAQLANGVMEGGGASATTDFGPRACRHRIRAMPSSITGLLDSSSSASTAIVSTRSCSTQPS